MRIENVIIFFSKYNFSQYILTIYELQAISWSRLKMIFDYLFQNLTTSVSENRTRAVMMERVVPSNLRKHPLYVQVIFEHKFFERGERERE